MAPSGGCAAVVARRRQPPHSQAAHNHAHSGQSRNNLVAQFQQRPASEFPQMRKVCLAICGCKCTHAQNPKVRQEGGM